VSPAALCAWLTRYNQLSAEPLDPRSGQGPAAGQLALKRALQLPAWSDLSSPATLSAASSSIDRRSGLGQGSVEVVGVVALSRLSTCVV
jgi:hypothetical protein